VHLSYLVFLLFSASEVSVHLDILDVHRVLYSWIMDWSGFFSVDVYVVDLRAQADASMPAS